MACSYKYKNYKMNINILKAFLVAFFLFINIINTFAQSVSAEAQQKILTLEQQLPTATFAQKIQIYQDIAHIYESEQLYAKQAEALENALTISEEQAFFGKALQISELLVVSYQKQGLSDQTYRLFQKSLQLTKRSGNKNNIALALANLASYEFRIGKYNESVKHYEDAHRYFVYELNNNKLGLQMLKNLVSACQKAGLTEKHLKYQQMVETIELDNKKSEFDKKTEVIEDEKNLLQVELNVTEDSLIHTSNQLKTVADSLQEMERIRKQREMELQIKDLQLAQQQARLDNERNVRNFLLLIIGLTIIFTLVLFVMYRQKKRANILLAQKNQEITLQKEKIEQQAEELKIQRDKYQRLSATKDKFFSVIAHDLKNPFNSIIGFSELLLDEYDNLPQQDKLDFIEMINKTAVQTNQLLVNLLQWARSQTGKIKFDPKENNLKEIIDNNIELMKQTASKKNINLYSQTKEKVKAVVDKNMIDTVLRNLIANAVKFTDEKGSVVVDCFANDAYVELKVKDTGVGIKKEKIPMLFDQESYYTTNGTQNEAGTGLGLSLCKEFVDKHNGQISVDSVLNEGTTFTVRLPLN